MTYDHQNRYSLMGLLERVTGAQQMLSTDHAALHAGAAYSAEARDAALANAAYLSIAIKAPLSVYVHLKHYEPWFNGDYGIFSVIEGCTIAGGSTASRNRNWASLQEMQSTVFVGATITGGTEIEGAFVSGGSGILDLHSFTGLRPLDIEWVLRPGTQYALKLLNNSGGNAGASLWAF